MSFRFYCLIYLMVKPAMDVADMQHDMQEHLQEPYNAPDARQLLPDKTCIHTVAVGKLPHPASCNGRMKT